MRNKLSFRSFALVALVAVALVIGLYGTTNRSKTNGGNGGISLEPPLFISTAEASTDATAFPADKAGISAYVKLPMLNIDKMSSLFSKVEDVGNNYIIGIVLIPNLGGDTEVHLYADTAGWLVAYLTQEEPAAKIMKWPEKYDYSPITKITTTTLQEALNSAGRAARLGIPREVKYYDFRFPDANAMTLFVKIPGIIQVKIPADYILYEASYYCYSGAYRGNIYIIRVGLKVDGVSISEQRTDKAILGSYKGAIASGVLHTIDVSGPNVSGSSRIATAATVLIYKKN